MLLGSRGPMRLASQPRMTTTKWIFLALDAPLGAASRSWFEGTCPETAAGLSDTEFCARLSRASRFAPRGALMPTETERRAAAEAVPGVEIERWTTLETVRVALVLSRDDLAEESAQRALETAFRFADEGELCALYRSLAHLPDAGRFAWRAGEGCRTNMKSVFEAVACDTPFPARHFDDVAFRQLAIKAVFIGAPLWRVVGLDGRIDEELARMALDLVEERRSAGRAVQPELWLCLGAHAGERGLRALEAEITSGTEPLGRLAAVLALARAGAVERVAELARTGPPELRDVARLALERRDAGVFRLLTSSPSVR